MFSSQSRAGPGGGPVRPNPISSQPAFSRTLIWERIFIYQAVGIPGVDGFRDYLAQLALARAQNKEPIAVVLVLSTAFSAPSAQMRQLIREKGGTSLGTNDEIHFVLPGQGMWGAIQRTVLEGLAVFGGMKRSRLVFHSTLEAALSGACIFATASPSRILDLARAAQIGVA